MKLLIVLCLYANFTFAQEASTSRTSTDAPERVTALAKRNEVRLGMSQNYSDRKLLDTAQLSLESTRHFDNRWSVVGGYAWVNNRYTALANNLRSQTGELPYVDYARHRIEARGQANLFYGKMRLTPKQSIGFDQYIGLGPVLNDMRSGLNLGWVGNLGLALYFGQRVTVHAGAKNYYQREERTDGRVNAHKFHGYLQAGLLF